MELAICRQSQRHKIAIILGRSALASSIGSLFSYLPHQRTFLSIFTWPDHSTTLMELCQLLYSLVQTPSPTLLLLLTFLWPGVVLSALATARVVLSVCRSTSRAGLSPLASGSIGFRDLVQIILLLSSFTVSPHIISLSNYFSSACQAVFIRRVFLPARLAFGLLIF